MARGIRIPIVREGDAIEQMVADSVIKAARNSGFELRDRDIVGITESVVARAQGNYASVDVIAKAIAGKFDTSPLGLVFPIMSRNRFATVLKAIARSNRKIVVQFSYPSDEVGNQLFPPEMLEDSGINPWCDDLTEEQFMELFGSCPHPFTGVDYISYYREIIESEGSDCTLIFSNRPQAILEHVRQVLVCDVHSRVRTRRILEAAGAERVFAQDDILTEPVNGSGYHPHFGLLGSNKCDEESVKLFPRDCQAVVDEIQRLFQENTGKTIEVLVYGDGAFKDPVGKIWELADPVVAPAYTSGLEGAPSEIKLKYLADNEYAALRGSELEDAIVSSIRNKKQDSRNSMAAQGTTPRRLTDLIGSLCDLTSGSGDKGTPVVHIQGYFDNLASS